MDEYKGWKLKYSFRRQIVFESSDGKDVCTAVDFGNFHNGDREWVTRLDEEIRTKIDTFGGTTPAERNTEQAVARVIEHNFNCHKILLEQHEVMRWQENQE